MIPFLRLGGVGLILSLLIGQALVERPVRSQDSRQKDGVQKGEGKKKAATKDLPPLIAGSTLGAGTFLGLAVDTPMSGRLLLVDPPVAASAPPPAASTKGLTAAQRKAVQAARQKALAQFKEQKNKPRNQYEFQVPEDAVIRFIPLPEPYDDKGNIVKPSKEELEKMRGSNKNLPGFSGRLDQIKAGQIIRVDQTSDGKTATVKMVVVVGDSNAPVEKAKETTTGKKKQ